MMIHYHGGPITPETCAFRAWHGRHAFVSYARPDQIKLAVGICQSFALDNGAYSFWKLNKVPNWEKYYTFVEEWHHHPAFDWAVIPDVIDGTEEENDYLVNHWPFSREEGVPVWHLNESVVRLRNLAARFPRVALGSTAEYDVSQPLACLARLNEVLPAICGPDGRPEVKLHGLRMLRPQIVTRIPLSSADSTNVARNIGIEQKWRRAPYAPSTKETRTTVLVERIEQYQSPDRLGGPGLHLGLETDD